MAVMMTLSVVVAWIPYSLVSLWAAFGDASAIPLWLNTIPVFFAKSSVCYDAIIYFFTIQRYRNYTRSVFFGDGAENETSTPVVRETRTPFVDTSPTPWFSSQSIWFTAQRSQDDNMNTPQTTIPLVSGTALTIRAT